MGRKSLTGLLAGLLLVVTGCSAATGGERHAAEPAGPEPALRDPHPCAGQPGFTCATLDVPLDHRGQVPGKLELQVAVADKADAPRGTLLFLTGGPGQPGVPFISRLAKQRLPQVAAEYRVVTLDQRGTGEFGAIDCPEVQAEIGGSDIAPASPAAVAACAKRLGDRAGLYGTDQTVADYELLRRALGVDTMVVDGVSYGSFTASRYAVAHPERVSKLVLDSVVAHHFTVEQSLYLGSLRATARVLRDACAQPPACEHDPAQDLAWLVRHGDRAAGVRLFDTVVSYEFVDPTYRDANPPGFPPGAGDLVSALREARTGDTARLDRLHELFAPGGGEPADFSSGLHVATLCTDARQPWGDARTPVPARTPLLRKAERELRQRDVWPYTPQVATGQGLVRDCLAWPRVRPTSNPGGDLPEVPTLLLAGDRDLSTPLESAEEQAAVTPQGKLVVVEGEAHSIQNRERGHAGRDAVVAFLLD